MNWTTLTVLVLFILVAAIVIMFSVTADATQRTALLDAFKQLVGFFVGAIAAGGAGFAWGFAKAKGLV